MYKNDPFFNGNSWAGAFKSIRHDFEISLSLLWNWSVMTLKLVRHGSKIGPSTAPAGDNPLKEV